MAQQPPLMPKATAVWLVDHTALSFEQIANFCHLHKLEVKGIADGDVARGIMGQDPTKNTIGAIRERTHWNMANLQPRNPVLLGICRQADLDAALAKAAAANPEAAAKAESNQAMFDENQPKAVIPEGIFAAFNRENG